MEFFSMHIGWTFSCLSNDVKKKCCLSIFYFLYFLLAKIHHITYLVTYLLEIHIRSFDTDLYTALVKPCSRLPSNQAQGKPNILRVTFYLNRKCLAMLG